MPGTISLTKDGKFHGYPVKYEVGKVSIMTASGTGFEDNTKDHNFKVSGISKYLTDDNKNMILHCANPESASPWLYVAVADQGSPKPNEVSSNLDASKDIISNIIFSSKMTGNEAKTLTRYISFASNPSVKDENYSDTISWTATEK
ncbi:hypothetical protein [Lactococcus lactis]|uniref:hypothetical protein n=1 Tax=Lactococcus lactis TaxID=1358 RepID=UPI001F582FEE|nr:hypothetical protein [Lactococcus lactis]